MYFMARAYYLNLTWGQKAFYNLVKKMIDPETREKMFLESSSDPPCLTEMFHPSQLEKRYGGTAETPKQFWPPMIGNDQFIPEKDREENKYMSESDYKAAIKDNPLLMRRPDMITDQKENTRDFKVLPPKI